jgi:glycosyltransferase involved in cell wall biosynthesis
VVVGDGPAREELQARYPGVHFTGVKHGEDLARAYAEADVFVFPSKTDTFGNTILEALASGVPVAAYPVTGPIDIIPAGSNAGALDHDLQIACIAALQASPASARRLAETYSWEAATQQFFDNVVEAKEQRRKRGLRQRFGARPAEIDAHGRPATE